MTEVGGATYVIDAKVDGVKRGMAAVKAEFREVQKEADRVRKNGAAAMRAFGGSIQALAGSSADPGKIARNWSRATGQLASDMGRFADAAKQQGISFAEMTQRLMHFRSVQFQATKGYGELYTVLKRYDAEAATMLRLSSSQAQSEAIVAAALARTTNATVKAKIEAAAYGLTVEKAGKQSMLMAGGVGSLGKAMAAFLTVTAATAAVRSVLQTVKAVGEIGDLADNIGMTTDQLQELQYAFVANGVSAEQSASGLQRYAEKLSDAQRGEGEFADLLKANNVALRDQEGNLRSSHEILREFANLIKNAATAEDALNMSVMVFGKQAGRSFVESLRNGADGLDDMAKAAHNAGAVTSEEMIRAADDIDTRYNKLMLSLSKGWQSLVIAVAGYAEQTLDNWVRVMDLIDQAAARVGLSDGTFSNVWAKGSLPPGVSTRPPLEIDINGGNTVIPPKSGESGRSKTRDEIDEVQRYIESLNEQIAALQLEIDTYGLSNAAKAKAIALSGLAADATDAQRAAVLAAAEAIAVKTESLDNLKAAEEEAKEHTEALAEAQKYFSDEIKDSFFSILDGSESVSEAFERMSKRLIQAMLEAVIFGEGPFAKLLGGGSSGGGGLLGGLLGSLLGIPKMARGGTSKGGPTLVGEQGPELVDLPAGARVTPNEDIGKRVAAILATGQRGAMAPSMPVITLAPKTSIIINNSAGADVSAEERRMGNGDRQILVMVDQRVARQMADPYSQSNGALTARGAAVRPKRR